MGAFLEQYGIAIFVLVIVGIMVLMANGLGNEIKGKVSQEINKFTSSTKVANQTAQDNSGYEGLDEVLVGPNAVAFSADTQNAAKILNDFSKANDLVQIKAGIIDGQVFDGWYLDAEYTKIAESYKMDVETVKKALEGRSNELVNNIFMSKIHELLVNNNKFN